MSKTKVVVNTDVFVQEWMAEVNAGGNIQNLATRLGLKPLSVYQRSRKLAEVLAGQAVTLPSLPMNAARKGSVKVEDLVNMITSLQKSNSGAE